MGHVAIMKKSWGLTEKILNGQKKIESRWYKTKRRPWNAIKVGDTVYFKNSGEPVTLKAQVEKAIQFSDLTPHKAQNILKKYGEDGGIERKTIPEFYERFKDKNIAFSYF